MRLGIIYTKDNTVREIFTDEYFATTVLDKAIKYESWKFFTTYNYYEYKVSDFTLVKCLFIEWADSVLDNTLGTVVEDLTSPMWAGPIRKASKFATYDLKLRLTITTCRHSTIAMRLLDKCKDLSEEERELLNASYLSK